MLFRYSVNDMNYVVSADVDEVPQGGNVNVKFLARINGGRGRLPKDRAVEAEDLQVLVDFETAKKLFKLPTS